MYLSQLEAVLGAIFPLHLCARSEAVMFIRPGCDSASFHLRVLVWLACLFVLTARPASAQSIPQLAQGSTQVITTPQVGQTVSPAWSIGLNDQLIASPTHTNGWFVLGGETTVLGHTVYKITVQVPANAAAGGLYSVHVNVLAVPAFSLYSNFTVVANSLQLLPPTITGNQGSTGIITLASPAPNGGLNIALSSNQASAAVPASITAAAGSTTVTFPITNTAVASKSTVMITAKSSHISLSANLIQLPVSFAYDTPPPAWAAGVVPRDGAAVSGFGPSATDTVNLASGVLESAPGPDAVAYNSVGPSAIFSRLYRSANAANGYSSPGLSSGWTHNFDVTAVSATGVWLPVILKYPNGATETWTPLVNANGLPTGAFILPKGAPYLATGQPDPMTPGHWLSLLLTFKDHSTWTLSPDPDNNTNYRLAQITNLVGHSLGIQYDSDQDVTAVVNDAQPPVTLLSFNYTAGYLSSITDAAGRTITYTFTALGNSSSALTDVSQINTKTDQWHYTYTTANASNWILLGSSAQPNPSSNGNGSGMLNNTITYGTDGRVASLTDANNNVHKYSYNNNPTAISYQGPQSSTNDPNYQQLFGSLNNMTGTIDAAAKSDQLQYTDTNNPYCPTLYLNRNGQTSTATYDPYGNLQETVAPLINGTLATTYYYDYSTFPLGNLTGVTVGFYEVGYSYYANGLVQTIATPDPSGMNPAVNVTYTYTALGNVATVSVPPPNQTGNNVTYTYNYVSDGGTTQAEALGEPLTVTDPNGNVTHFRWDNRGNLITVIDGLGNTWQYTYNLADQLINVQAPLNGTGQLQINTKYLYLNGPATQVILNDTTGAAFRTTSVALGNEGEELADQGNTEQAGYQYDDTLRLLGLKDALGNTYAHTYNNVDDLTSLQYPGGMAQLQYQYDADHNLKTFTNARNQQTTFALALDGTPTSYTRADGTQVSAMYDWAGRVTQLSDAQTTLSYTYNIAGPLSSETTTYLVNNGTPDTEIDYFYNCDGSINNINTVWGSYCYAYDNGGRVTSITFPSGHMATYNYDADNRLTHQGLADHDTYYQYNALGQLTQQQVVGVAENTSRTITLNQYNNFSYDAAGNLLGYTWTCPQLNYNSQNIFTNSFSFTYDTFDHLASETSNGNLYVSNTNNFGGIYSTNYNWTHSSDAGDNLTELRNFSFSGNALDQVTLDSNINSSAAYQYDTDGNATTYYGAPCTYDTEGHLTSYGQIAVELNHSILQNGTVPYGYRPDGRLAWRIDPSANVAGAKLYYLYIGGRVFLEYDPTTYSTRTYDWGVTGLTETETVNDPSSDYASYITSYS
jgi:YD repeat-containing protein